MKTAGQILKETRLKKNFKIFEISSTTKILPIYLQALENDDYQKLPSATSARGFLKNYADFLGLNSASMLAVFRRDFEEGKTKEAKISKEKMIKKAKFIWEPKMTSLVGVGLLAIAFVAYLIWQYFSLVHAPYY